MSGGNYKKHSWSRYENCKGVLEITSSKINPKTKVYWCPAAGKWLLTKCACVV